MTKVKRKYIDSHWLIFAIEGIIAMLFGWYIMFSGSQNAIFLTTVTSVMLLIMGLIELFNVLHREHHGHTWGLSLIVAIFELAAALLLFLSLDQSSAVSLTILASYTLIRGIFEILIAFKTVEDSTDKFIWMLCGICGVIFAFVVLNSGHFAEGTFVKFFGSYLMILGLADLIYGIHNYNKKQDDKLARQEAHKKITKKTKKRK